MVDAIGRAWWEHVRLLVLSHCSEEMAFKPNDSQNIPGRGKRFWDGANVEVSLTELE